jgi:hypothetical protein
MSQVVEKRRERFFSKVVMAQGEVRTSPQKGDEKLARLRFRAAPRRTEK